MKKHYIVGILLAVVLTNSLKAQPNKGKFIKAAIGIGYSATDDRTDFMGDGFYAQGEYVMGLSKWFGVRPYAGVVFTKAGEIDRKIYQEDYKVTSRAFLFGGKVRVLGPTPYVAPYFEIGLGASVGGFQTFTTETNINKSGLFVHVPFAAGLAVGREHNYEIEFTYYIHPELKQTSGAAAFGITFPIE
jgi:hypothetical protein